MDRFFLQKKKKWTFQDLHFSKSKNQKLTLILERRVFSRKKKSKVGKVGSQISCTVFTLDKVIITRVVIAWPTSSTFLKAP